jgi:uncharacterized protein YigE (DUF2233 family)
LAAQKKKTDVKKASMSAAALAEAKARKAKEKKKRDKTHHNQVCSVCVLLEVIPMYLTDH